jgi:hypothetical protein
METKVMSPSSGWPAPATAGMVAELGAELRLAGSGDGWHGRRAPAGMVAELGAELRLAGSAKPGEKPWRTGADRLTAAPSAIRAGRMPRTAQQSSRSDIG